MYNVEVNNGELEVINSGSVIIQDVTKPLELKLKLPNTSPIKVRFKFEIVESLKDAGASPLDTSGDDTTSLLLKVPKDHSMTQVVDAPVATLGEEGKIYLAISWTVDHFGAIRFDYTFSASKLPKSNNVKRKSAS